MELWVHKDTFLNYGKVRRGVGPYPATEETHLGLNQLNPPPTPKLMFHVVAEIHGPLELVF